MIGDEREITCRRLPVISPACSGLTVIIILGARAFILVTTSGIVAINRIVLVIGLGAHALIFVFVLGVAAINRAVLGIDVDLGAHALLAVLASGIAAIDAIPGHGCRGDAQTHYDT